MGCNTGRSQVFVVVDISSGPAGIADDLLENGGFELFVWRQILPISS